MVAKRKGSGMGKMDEGIGRYRLPDVEWMT